MKYTDSRSAYKCGRGDPVCLAGGRGEPPGSAATLFHKVRHSVPHVQQPHLEGSTATRGQCGPCLASQKVLENNGPPLTAVTHRGAHPTSSLHTECHPPCCTSRPSLPAVSRPPGHLPGWGRGSPSPSPHAPHCLPPTGPGGPGGEPIPAFSTSGGACFPRLVVLQRASPASCSILTSLPPPPPSYKDPCGDTAPPQPETLNQSHSHRPFCHVRRQIHRFPRPKRGRGGGSLFCPPHPPLCPLHSRPRREEGSPGPCLPLPRPRARA